MPFVDDDEIGACEEEGSSCVTQHEKLSNVQHVLITGAGKQYCTAHDGLMMLFANNFCSDNAFASPGWWDGCFGLG